MVEGVKTKIEWKDFLYLAVCLLVLFFYFTYNIPLNLLVSRLSAHSHLTLLGIVILLFGLLSNADMRLQQIQITSEEIILKFCFGLRTRVIKRDTITGWYNMDSSDGWMTTAIYLFYNNTFIIVSHMPWQNWGDIESAITNQWTGKDNDKQDFVNARMWKMLAVIVAMMLMPLAAFYFSSAIWLSYLTVAAFIVVFFNAVIFKY